MSGIYPIDPKKIKSVGVERYVEDQLVVALPDLGLVHSALQEAGVTWTEEDRHQKLGLALLRLTNLPTAMAALAPATAAESHGVGPGSSGTGSAGTGAAHGGRAGSELDALLVWIRARFSASYGNWIPTIGKNRVLAPVRGFPYVSGGGEGNPSVAADDQGNPYVSGGGGGNPRASIRDLWEPRDSHPGRGVRVAVLDTRLYPNSWLTGGYLATSHALLDKASATGPLPTAAEGHATFIAGLILHRAPGAQLDVRHVLDADALGSVWDAAKKMVDFTGSGVDVMNLSFGCYTENGDPPLVLARAISRISPEIVVVAAAGNHGGIDQAREDAIVQKDYAPGLTSKTPMWPAAFEDVVAVGAADSSGDRAPFSPNLPWVDVTAPGVDVQSTYLDGEVCLDPAGQDTSEGTSTTKTDAPRTAKFNGTARWSGTSFAAANVSGAIAAGTRPGRRTARAALEMFLHPEDGDILPFFFNP